jgi:hypothetical protein
MFNLAPENAPWFEHLTDSVRALGEAALEWQHAHRHADLSRALADVQRRTIHDGKVTGQPGPDTRGWDAAPATRHPHSNAVFDVQRIYSDLQSSTRVQYESAALLFASGAAWAVRTVRAGETPACVVLPLAEDRRLVPGALDADIDALKEARLSTAPRIAAAHRRLTDCLHAGSVGQEISEQDYVSDHEASQMYECWEIAAGTADAAYAYGLLVEQALGFVLLGPRTEHRRRLAEQRAAQEPTTRENGTEDVDE